MIAVTKPTRKVYTLRRQRVAGVVAIAPVMAGLLAFGADHPVLAAMLALIQIFGFATVALLMDPELSENLGPRARPPLALFAAALVWSVLAAGLSPSRMASAGLEWLKLLGVASTAATLAITCLGRHGLRAFALNLLLLSVAYTIFSLWIGQNSPYTVWGVDKGAHTYRFTGTLMNANAAGAVFATFSLIGLAPVRDMIARTDLRTSSFTHYALLALGGGGVLVSTAACVLTGSRAALVMLGLGTLAVAWREWCRSRDRWIAAGLFLGLLAAVLASAQVAGRWSTIIDDAAHRAMILRHYLTAAAPDMLFGVGLGGFRPWNTAHLDAATAAALWSHGAAHMALLQAAIEGGAPFALLLLAAVATMLWQILRSGANDLAIDCSLAALALLAVCSSVDIALNTPAIAALAAAILGSAWGGALSSRRAAPQSQAAPNG